MILDTSAIVAIMQDEHDSERYARAIDEAESVRISAATLFETSIVVDGNDDARLSRALDTYVRAAALEVVDFGPEHAAIAREAYRVFGKGSGHRAKLNFGDCFSYALAYAADEPLLFKGDDFIHTDIKSAIG